MAFCRGAAAVAVCRGCCSCGILQTCCRSAGMLQSLLEVVLEVLPVDLACQKGWLGHMAMLHQGNLAQENSKLTGSQLKAEPLEALSQLLHINAWLVPAKKKKAESTCFCQSTRLVTCGRTSRSWQSTDVTEP